MGANNTEGHLRVLFFLTTATRSSPSSWQETEVRLLLETEGGHVISVPTLKSGPKSSGAGLMNMANNFEVAPPAYLH